MWDLKVGSTMIGYSLADPYYNFYADRRSHIVDRRTLYFPVSGKYTREVCSTLQALFVALELWER